MIETDLLKSLGVSHPDRSVEPLYWTVETAERPDVILTLDVHMTDSNTLVAEIFESLSLSDGSLRHYEPLFFLRAEPGRAGDLWEPEQRRNLVLLHFLGRKVELDWKNISRVGWILKEFAQAVSAVKRGEFPLLTAPAWPSSVIPVVSDPETGETVLGGSEASWRTQSRKVLSDRGFRPVL